MALFVCVGEAVLVPRWKKLTVCEAGEESGNDGKWGNEGAEPPLNASFPVRNPLNLKKGERNLHQKRFPLETESV